MIKLQLYHSLITVDYGKIYKHDLADLESYARSEGVTLAIPKYIADRLALISTWEAEGCYDTHFVVRTDTLKLEKELQMSYIFLLIFPLLTNFTD